MSINSKTCQVWIDLDNSPHVPFFIPIIRQLEADNISVLLTARDAFQVSELIDLHQLSCRKIGTHFGKNPIMKIVGLLFRALQLIPLVLVNRPHLAVSHGSRAQMLAAKLLGIRTILIADYEHARHIVSPDILILPEVVGSAGNTRLGKRVEYYPGIKEDVYINSLVPDRDLLRSLGCDESTILVTVRPPATEAHYHNPESEKLFEVVMKILCENNFTKVVLLPRNNNQKKQLGDRWQVFIHSGKIVIPDRALDGLNLVWNSDLVISGGGTMNREAAALNVPVYSIFRGKMGAVDRYLADHGRLILIQSEDDLKRELKIEKRAGRDVIAESKAAALSSIVNHIKSALD